MIPWVPSTPCEAAFDSRAIYAFKMFNDISDQSTVWRVRVPVIAEEGANSLGCHSVQIPDRTTATRDPYVEPNRTYRVIGFVDMIIYDVDIGRPPANYQIQEAYSVDLANPQFEDFPEAMRFQQNCNNVRARVTCGNNFIPSSASQGFPVPRLINPS